ncbi:MAG TPA: LamG-like jellyroll fold domain-containing protein, partial [Terriglobales bacterium]|nr:LamG-like jellyroll fold domain-containing protein [Terriglobales bacterium]
AAPIRFYRMDNSSGDCIDSTGNQDCSYVEGTVRHGRPPLTLNDQGFSVEVASPGGGGTMCAASAQPSEYTMLLFWRANFDQTNHFLAGRVNSSDDFLQMLGVRDDSAHRFTHVVRHAGGEQILMSTTAVQPATTYCIAGTLDAAGAKLFVNGVQEAATSALPPPNGDSTARWQMWRLNASGWSSSIGRLDNVAFFDRALSPAEVHSLCGACMVLPSTPTPTQTRTFTHTAPPTATRTRSSTRTPTATRTRTATIANTSVPTEAASHMPTLTPTPTETPPTATDTPIPQCPAVPRDDCVGPRLTAISLKRGSTSSGNRMSWKWMRGSIAEVATFGDPVSLGGTEYTLCLYDFIDGTPQLALQAAIPAGSMCGSRPCWKRTSRGFVFRGRTDRSGGIQQLTLQSGIDGRAAIKLRAGGEALTIPAPHAATSLLAQNDQVVVHLANDSQPNRQCWSATYVAPAQRIVANTFRDKE